MTNGTGRAEVVGRVEEAVREPGRIVMITSQLRDVSAQAQSNLKRLKILNSRVLGRAAEEGDEKRELGPEQVRPEMDVLGHVANELTESIRVMDDQLTELESI